MASAHEIEAELNAAAWRSETTESNEMLVNRREELKQSENLESLNDQTVPNRWESKSSRSSLGIADYELPRKLKSHAMLTT